MGQRHSELNPRDMTALSDVTHFKEDEIKTFYRDFKKQYPRGLISREGLRQAYKKVYPNGNPDEMVEEIFRVYDINMSGRLDFREFLCGVGVMAHGALEDKLKLAFSMYDTDGSGLISQEEVRCLIRAIYKATVTNKKLGYDQEKADSLSQQLFAKLDKDGDQQVTMDEFVEVAKADPAIVEMLTQDGVLTKH